MGDGQTRTSEVYCQQLTRLKAVNGRKNGLLWSIEKEWFCTMTMPDNATLQVQPKISLKKMTGKSLQNHLMGQRLTSREEIEMKTLVSFFEPKLAKFYKEGMGRLMARWEDKGKQYSLTIDGVTVLQALRLIRAFDAQFPIALSLVKSMGGQNSTYRNVILNFVIKFTASLSERSFEETAAQIHSS
ncbi:hypothetical protein ACTXT7_006939 [Hymenolepis weldensis]